MDEVFEAGRGTAVLRIVVPGTAPQYPEICIITDPRPAICWCAIVIIMVIVLTPLRNIAMLVPEFVQLHTYRPATAVQLSKP